MCLTSLWYLGFCGEFTHFPVCITIDQRSICGVYSTIAVNICRQLLRICQCVSSINRAIDDCCIRGIYDAISVHIPIYHIRLRVCLCILKGEQGDGPKIISAAGFQCDRHRCSVRIADITGDGGGDSLGAVTVGLVAVFQGNRADSCRGHHIYSKFRLVAVCSSVCVVNRPRCR